MNELSDPRANAEEPAVSRPEPVAASRVRESALTGKLYTALAKAQLSFISPPRNKEVEVRTKAGGTYKFRYATLDAINDMLREPLGANGLALIQPPVVGNRALLLVTKLIHGESDQWVECELPVPSAGGEMQTLGSNLSYLRRYSITSLLNIAADEDDDNNIASGNHMSPADTIVDRPPPPVADAYRETVMRQIARYARAARDPDDIQEMLAYWLAQAEGFEPYRNRPASGVLEWVEDTVGDAIAGVMGNTVGAVWVSALRATSAANLNVLEAHLTGKWGATLAKLRAELPEVARLLDQHISQQIARAEAALGIERQIDTEQAASDTVDPAPIDTSATEANPVFQLFDQHGENTGGMWVRASDFMRAFLALWHPLDDAGRRVLEEFNEDTLIAASIDAAAWAIWKEEGERELDRSEVYIDPPRNGAGNIQLADYFSIITASLSKLNTEKALTAWLEHNRPVIVTTSPGVQVKVLSRLNARRAELGLPPANLGG